MAAVWRIWLPTRQCRMNLVGELLEHVFVREVAFAHREASEAIGVVPLQEVVAVAGLVGERQIVVDHAVASV